MNLKNILVTGLSGFWGEIFASYLDERDEYEKIIGIDSIPPKKTFKRVKYREWNPINESILQILEEEKIDGVCHLNFIPVKFHDEKMFQRNVLGAMNLLSACVRLKIQKVAMMSSFIVYGAKGSNPNFIPEESSTQRKRFAYQENNDLLEIDDYVTDFIRLYPDFHLTMLRFCSIIGPTVNTPMTKYLSYPVVPTLLGFDPMFQFIHEQDVLYALAHALKSDYHGVVNVAASDVIPLSKAKKICSQTAIPLFHPIAYTLSQFLNNIKLARLRLLEVDFLRYNCIVDTIRMKEQFQFVPEKTAEETLREFAEHRRLKQIFPLEKNVRELESSARLGFHWGTEKVKSKIEEQIQSFLNKRHLPTTEQLESLSQRIDQISERIDQLAGNRHV